MKEKYLLSIIVPLYNCEKHISQCLKSVIEQNFQNWEIVIVDDGSTDKGPAICQQFVNHNPRIKIIHQENQGLGPTRNVGINESSGEYLIFLDSDDFLNHDSLENLAAVIKDNNAPDMIFCRASSFYEKNNTKKDFFGKYAPDRIFEKSPIEILLYLFEPPIESFWSAWNHVYKRKIVIDNNLRFPNHLGEDLDWTPKVILKSESFAFLQKPYYNYRVSENSTSSNSFNHEFYVYKVALKWLQAINSLKITDQQKQLLKTNFAGVYYSNLWQMWNKTREQRKKIVELLLKNKFVWTVGKSRKCKILGLSCRVLGPLATAFLLNIRQRLKKKLSI